MSDYGKPFEVHTDASGFAIGGVLMQEEHPISYESRKLNDTKRQYTIQEKEMTAIVHCLRTWRHYLLGSHFLIKTNNATSYFQTQKKLSSKQARRQDFLAEFDYEMEYKSRKANYEANAQSQKPELAAICQPKCPMLDQIKEAMEDLNLMKMAKKGKTRRIWVKENLHYTKGDMVYVPKWGDFKEGNRSRVS